MSAVTTKYVRRFLQLPEEKSKDVPWPFRLQPVNAMRAKDECFSAVSEEELQVSILIRYSTIQYNTINI